VLARVSAALTRFIAPLTTSASRETFVRDRPPQEQPTKREPKEAPKLRVVPTEVPDVDGRLLAIPNAKSTSVKGGDEAPTHSFTELFLLFQDQRTRMIHSSGRRAYRESVENRRKTGRFRKGAMLDDRAE
jgi:hypothetical protein